MCTSANIPLSEVGLPNIVTRITFHENDAAQNGYFIAIITSSVSPVVFMLLFLSVTAFVAYRGVEKEIHCFR